MKQAKLSFAGRTKNPTKASPAQLAARARFAEMARSGAFKKKATKRKANPSTYDPYAPRDHLAEYRTKTDAQLRHIMQDAGEAAKAMRGHSPRAEEKYLDQINDAATILWERKQKASKRKVNPTDIHLAGNYYGKVSKDGTGSFWTYVVNRVKEVNPDGSLYETDDVVGDFKAKHYATMKGAVNALNKYKEKLSGVKRNPAKKTVSQKISQLRHEGYPQRQAVAVALSEQRAGKVKRNPKTAKPKKYYQVSIMQEGLHKTWMPMALFLTFAEAENYSHHLAKQHKNWTIRVHDTRAM